MEFGKLSSDHTYPTLPMMKHPDTVPWPGCSQLSCQVPVAFPRLPILTCARYALYRKTSLSISLSGLDSCEEMCRVRLSSLLGSFPGGTQANSSGP